MKAFVNDNCIGCGICVGLCPEVFHMTPEGHAEATTDVPPEYESPTVQAQASCPANAIEVER